MAHWLALARAGSPSYPQGDEFCTRDLTSPIGPLASESRECSRIAARGVRSGGTSLIMLKTGADAAAEHSQALLTLQMRKRFGRETSWILLDKL